ncbi:MAG: hypothetical protein KJO34_01785 [Deltaproteobacteria bacterium]|nr:hypothetical protein [Deltaproteobacteria bacterium]
MQKRIHIIMIDSVKGIQYLRIGCIDDVLRLFYIEPSHMGYVVTKGLVIFLRTVCDTSSVFRQTSQPFPQSCRTGSNPASNPTFLVLPRPPPQAHYHGPKYRIGNTIISGGALHSQTLRQTNGNLIVSAVQASVRAPELKRCSCVS